MNNNCKRCGIYFSERRGLMKHLRRKNVCIGIESERTQEELLEELNKKEGLECEECKRVYKNEESLRKHRCKGVKEVTMKEDAVTIMSIEDSKTVVINDIDNINGIDYILKDVNFAEKILKWVRDEHGLLRYIDEKYYNEERPENRGIRKIDSENIEVHMKGKWNRYDNKTTVGAIIESLRIDWRMIISRMKYNYSDDYENNKKEFVTFKREVSDPLRMGLDISDDEDEM
jgi:hypothetical protein